MTATSDNAILARVRRGAALLDERRPGWWERVDLDTLRVSSPCRCVLGQEFGNFYAGLFWLQRTISVSNCDWEADHGFIAVESEWTELTAAWRAEIIARRTQAQQEQQP